MLLVNGVIMGTDAVSVVKLKRGEWFLHRMNLKTKKKIAENIVAFMSDGTPLLQEAVLFIYNWVMTGGTEKTKSYYDVWDIVLKIYLPLKRPLLFRSCQRLSKRDIQSFTGRIHAADKFSEKRTGHLLICDTEEYLQFEDKNATEHERSFFPLCECIKRGTYCTTPYFRESFYKEYEKEDEYIVRVNNNWLYDLKWNRN